MALERRGAIAKRLGVSRSSLYYKPKKPSKDERLRDKISMYYQDPMPDSCKLYLGWGFHIYKFQRKLCFSIHNFRSLYERSCWV